MVSTHCCAALMVAYLTIIFVTQAQAAPPEPVAKTVAPALKAQGGWYTPLTRPGMPAPYDINGYHKPSEPKPAPSGGDRKR
ncbi:MAG: hypothetical protein HZC25_14495 [Rhodospirillales bacterium]|nr:hypothetical protein [Rhodospirillales bacterium]